MFKTFGCEEVYVLDGGLPAWESIGGMMDTAPVVKTDVNTKFEAKDNSENLIPYEKVVELVKKNKSQSVIDARPKVRFSGDSVEPRKGVSSGHIPGSKNVPCSSLLDENQCFRSKSEIKEIFESAGVSLDEEKFHFTCGSGVTACIDMLALLEIGVEFNRCMLYDGSFSEWGARYNN